MCHFSNKREETISACLVFRHPRDKGGGVLGVPHWSTQRTQHLHVYQHLFGLFPGSLGCEVQSCSILEALLPLGQWENNHGGSLELVGACPRFLCASSKWTARGSGCTTIKVVFATLLVISKCLNKREEVLKFFN